MPHSHWINDPVLAGSGECAALMRSLDWSKSPLGPPAGWPIELRTLVSVMLPALQPMFICWGPEQTMLYNDAYAELCGTRHPKGMGQSFRELWFDIWEQIKPVVDSAYAGIGTKMDDIQFTMYRNGHEEETHFSFSYTPVRDASYKVAGFFCTCTETTHLFAARKRQQSELERLQAMFRQAPGGIAILDGKSHVFTLTNDAFDAIVRVPVIGKPLAEAVPDAIAQGFGKILETVSRTGEPHVGRGVPYVSDGGTLKRHFDFVFQPITETAGTVTSVFVLVHDVSERVKAEQHQQTRNREIVHRLKNQLAMVQAIVTQTMRNAPDLQTAKDRIIERITALGRAHDLLLNGTSGTTSLRQLVDSLKTMHDDKSQARINMQGPDLRIGARPALSLALILHELSTNAVKYGSLSTPAGRVDVTWGTERNSEDENFSLSWIESGGPRIEAPKRKGTGSRLIQAGLNGVNWSEVTTDYDPSGVRCRITTSLRDLTHEPDEAQPL